MKKIIFIILLLMLVLCGCNNNTVTNLTNTTLESDNQTSAQNIDFEKETEDSFVEETESNFTAKETTTTNESNIKTTNSSNSLHSDPPAMINFTLEDISNLKETCESMQEEEFQNYLLNDGKYFYDNGITTFSEAKEIISLIEKTTVPLLDGNKENFYKIKFYVEDKDMFQPVIFSETRNIGFSYYLPESNREIIKTFENRENAPFVKEITSNGVTAKVYYSDEEYYIETVVDNTQMFGRFIETNSLEQIEADFARLSFVKIGDLIK